MNAYIQVAYGPSGYKVEKWLWNADANEYVLDDTHPDRFSHRYQAEAQALSWASAQNIRFIP
jgi:hypothetical protein